MRKYKFATLLTKFTSLLQRTAKAFTLSNGRRLINNHPRRPRGSQSSWEKRREETFQARAEEPLGTDSHRTISKWSSEYWLLIGHKKCFVLLSPIGEQHLLSSFCEFLHNGY